VGPALRKQPGPWPRKDRPPMTTRSNHTPPPRAESLAINAYRAHVRSTIERHAAANPGNPFATLRAAGAELGIDRVSVERVARNLAAQS
jgi:hypothetical protein